MTEAKGVPQQIVERAVMAHELNNFLQATALSVKVKALCDSMLQVGHIQRAMNPQGACLLGSSRKVGHLTEPEVDALVTALGFQPSSLTEHDRFVLDDQLYHSASYARAKKRISSTIQCKNGRTCTIMRALRVQVEGAEEGIPLCKQLLFAQVPSKFPPHIEEATITPGTALIAVRIQDVKYVRLHIVRPNLKGTFEGQSYVCCLPNDVEWD